MAQLSSGCIRAIYQGQEPKQPIVQIIDIKKIQGPSGQQNQQERFRLVISDGSHFQQAMVSTQLNELIHTQTIATQSLVRLDDYLCNTVQERR